MADKLINADVLLKVLDEELEDILKEETGFATAIKANILVGFAKQVINDAPAVDAEPVRHGRWLWHDVNGVAFYMKECSACGWTHALNSHYLYCPNCGARMDERSEEG